jgi:hypothetical protein
MIAEELGLTFQAGQSTSNIIIQETSQIYGFKETAS